MPEHGSYYSSFCLSDCPTKTLEKWFLRKVANNAFRDQISTRPSLDYTSILNSRENIENFYQIESTMQNLRISPVIYLNKSYLIL